MAAAASISSDSGTGPELPNKPARPSFRQRLSRNFSLCRSDDAGLADAPPMPPPLAAASPPTPHQATSAVSDFTLGEEVGRGAYGRVRLATRQADGARVAIKVLNRRTLDQSGQHERAREEWRVMRALAAAPFPMIVRLLDAFADDVALYLVLDYCEGGEVR